MKSRRINKIKLGVAPEGFVLSILLLLLSIPVFSQERIWEGTKCKNRSVTLTEYLPEGEPRAAIVVCPGGS